MNFKDQLGIEDKSWLGIGKHLGEIVGSRLKQKNKSKADLAAHLQIPLEIEGDSIYPNVVYVDGYMKSYSFGCFWPSVQKYLGIDPKMLFSDDVTEEELKSAQEQLTQYLTTISYESMVCFMTVQPGKDLQDYVINLMKNGTGNEDFTSFFGSQKRKNRIVELFMEYLRAGKLSEVLNEEELSNVPDFERFMSRVSFAASVPADKFVPIREPTKAERWEVYNRWRTNGGGYRPGPDETGKHREPTEQEEYLTNSNLTIIFALIENFDRLIDDYI